MEILRLLESSFSWRLCGDTRFELPQGVAPSEFFQFITDTANAHVVFSNPFYRIERITSNGELPKDPDILRRVGAQLTFEGMLLRPIEAPMDIDARVTRFIQDRHVKVASRTILIDGKRFQAELQAGWDIDQVDGITVAALHAEYIPHGLWAHMIGKAVPQFYIDAEMALTGARIKEGFLQERVGRSLHD